MRGETGINAGAPDEPSQDITSSYKSVGKRINTNLGPGAARALERISSRYEGISQTEIHDAGIVTLGILDDAVYERGQKIVIMDANAPLREGEREVLLYYQDKYPPKELPK